MQWTIYKLIKDTPLSEIRLEETSIFSNVRLLHSSIRDSSPNKFFDKLSIFNFELGKIDAKWTIPSGVISFNAMSRCSRVSLSLMASANISSPLSLIPFPLKFKETNPPYWLIN